MSERRLIEEWLPIGALGEESVRERRSMTALPPTYYLHVWWARRPLVASRAAVLASLLPADADHDKFLHAIGIHGDPVLTKRRIDAAKRTGEDLGLNPYGYSRAFQYTPDAKEKAILNAAVGGEIAKYARARSNSRRGKHSIRGGATWCPCSRQRSESCCRSHSPCNH